METTRGDGDARSPKRQATGPLHIHASAATAVAALDDEIWTSIIEFLPMPKDVELTNSGGSKVEWHTRIAHYDAAVADIVATWKTLLDLRLVSKKLTALLHPAGNAALWRRLLLQGFDFSVDGGDRFNVENHQDQCGLERSSDPEDEAEDDEDPQVVAMRGRYDDLPAEYLEEDLVSWPKLGIHHRPSQYGFLTALQQQPAAAQSWPESEDAFSLFGDLVRLLQLPHGEGMEAGGEGCDTTVKYLAAPTEANVNSTFYQSYVMKTLGYVPHFWHWGRGISDEWRGFTEPEELEACITSQLVDEDGDDAGDGSFDDVEDDFEFPNCCVSDAKLLFQHIRQHCRDWRSACCNSNSDGYTLVFFVGESKTFPHRCVE